MSVSDINRVRLAISQESSYGIAVTNHNLQKIRLTSETLKQNTESTVSKEIRDDRQTTGIVRTKVGTAGEINFEFSFATFEDLIAAALMSDNVHAQGTLTLDTQPTDGDTMTIGSTTYRFETTMSAANDIKIGATLADTQVSIVKTINGTGLVGTDYYAGTVTPHPLVWMASFVTNNAVITAWSAGEAGNSIATTETFTAGTNVFDAATLGTTTAGAGWTNIVTVTASTISAAASDNSFNDSGAGFGSIIANEWIKASGFTNAANNGCFKVVSATANKIIVSAGTLVDEASGTSRTIKQGSSVVNGTTKNSFHGERVYSDLTDEIVTFLGLMVNTMTLSVGTGGMVTGNFGFIGKTEESGTVSLAPGYNNANANEVMNSIDNVIGVYESDVAINLADFTLNLTNNLRERLKIGSAGAFGIGTGKIFVSGSLTAYYESKAMYDKYLNWTTTSLAKVFQDAGGNIYVIDIPSVKLSDASRHAGSGENNDFMVPCTWQAFLDATEQITIRIVRFPA